MNLIRWIDRSPLLINLLGRLSSLLARQRGLPILIGIILFAVGFFLQFINLSLNSPLVELLYVLFHNIGILTALIGILMAEPLGK